MTHRLVAIPNTNGELARDLGRLKELLLVLQPYEADDQPAPPGLALVALEALQRIRSTVLAAVRRPAPELMGSDGTMELMPVHFAELDDADLAVVGEAVAALRVALPSGARQSVVAALRQGIDLREQPADLVAKFANAHGLLDLRADDDTRMLADLVDGHTGNLVLTVAEEQAYNRLTDRLLAMFREGWQVGHDSRACLPTG